MNVEGVGAVKIEDGPGQEGQGVPRFHGNRVNDMKLPRAQRAAERTRKLGKAGLCQGQQQRKSENVPHTHPFVDDGSLFTD